MFELQGFSDELNTITNKLDLIRKLSKGLIPDYRHYPYESDFELIKCLLDEKVENLLKEKG